MPRHTPHPSSEAGSAFWMARVVRAAQSLSEIEGLAKRGVVGRDEVIMARANYEMAREMYTNPFHVPKGVAA